MCIKALRAWSRELSEKKRALTGVLQNVLSFLSSSFRLTRTFSSISVARE